MADLEMRGKGARNPPVDESLPTLFGRLSDDLSKLVDLRLTLFKVEMKEDLAAYVRRSVIIVIGAVVAIVGFALLNVALAFFTSALFASLDVTQPTRYALGFIVTGIVYLVIGGIIVVVTKNRMARQGLVPTRTVNEFEKDKQLLKSVIEN